MNTNDWAIYHGYLYSLIDTVYLPGAIGTPHTHLVNFGFSANGTAAPALFICGQKFSEHVHCATGRAVPTQAIRGNHYADHCGNACVVLDAETEFMPGFQIACRVTVAVKPPKPIIFSNADENSRR